MKRTDFYFAEYDPADLKDADMPTINQDGSVSSPGLMSTEDAERAFAVSNGTAVPTEAVATPTVAPPTTEQPGSSLDIADPPPAGQPAPAAIAPVTPVKKEEPERKTPEGSITVGGITKTKAEWLTEAENEVGADFSTLPLETQEKLTQQYIDSKHKAAWQRSNQEKATEVSQTRKVNEEESRRLQAEHDEIARQKATLALTQRNLNAEKERLSKVAANKIERSEYMDDEQRITDPDKMRQHNKALDAQERLAEIEAQQHDLAKEISDTDARAMLSEIAAFQSAHPEFATPEPFATTHAKFEARDHSVTPHKKVVLDIIDILGEAAQKRISVEDAYNRLHELNRLTTRPTATAPLPVNENPKPSSAAATAARIAERQTSNPSFSSSQTATNPRPAITSKESIADRMHEHSMASRGGSNKALDDMNF